VQRELAAADPVLGDASTVQRFLANALQRFNGQLRATAGAGVFELQPGDLAALYRAAGDTDFPRRVAFDQVTRHDGAGAGAHAPAGVRHL